MEKHPRYLFVILTFSIFVSCSSSKSTKTTTKSSSPKLTKPVHLGMTMLAKPEYLGGWISLFDGKTMMGWHQSAKVDWKISEGVLSAEGKEQGLLITTVPFSDYEFRCDYRLEKGGNSGVFLRSAAEIKNPGKDCYELNMCDSHESFPTGSLVGRKVADGKHEGEGVWKSWRVVVLGNRITAYLDNKLTVDLVDKTNNLRTHGFIGLQKRTGKIEFRNIKLKPMGIKSLFDGTTLNGWKIIPGNKAKIVVDDKTIRLSGGQGFLQSEKEYGDFILQTQVKTEAADANSGIFFRSMSGSEDQPSNGYELQIQNTIVDGDRAKPDDYQSGYGTGAIFRRQKVRWVVPNDREWFSITLIAHGNRFATWVNGYQVVDWIDERKPDDNPRNGLRLKPGYFILQSHDPKTDIRFRYLWIR